jgi:hypothetical protein
VKEIKVDINGIEHTVQVDDDDPRAVPGTSVGTDDPKKSATPANKSRSTDKK